MKTARTAAAHSLATFIRSARSTASLLGIAMVLGACASEPPPLPTRGDLMIAQASSTSDLGERWNEGSEMATEAEQVRLDAERSLARAERDVREARKTIEDSTRREARGRAMMAEAEAEFARRFPGQTLGVGATPAAEGAAAPVEP